MKTGIHLKYEPLVGFHMRIIMGFLLLTLVGLQYKLWLGDGNLFQWFQLEKKRFIQEEENKKFLAQNRAIEADIAELKSGAQALEELARYELGMIKENEIYYHFIE